VEIGRKKGEENNFSALSQLQWLKTSITIFKNSHN